MTLRCQLRFLRETKSRRASSTERVAKGQAAGGLMWLALLRHFLLCLGSLRSSTNTQRCALHGASLARGSGRCFEVNAALEFVHAAGSVYELLLTGVERMAGSADLNVHRRHG